MSQHLGLTLKAQITTTADDILKFIFFFFIIFQRKQVLIFHVKYQLVFFEKLEKIKIKCRLLQILLGTLRVNTVSGKCPKQSSQHF